MAESVTQVDTAVGHTGKYIRYSTQERVIDSRQSGWITPWTVKRYRGKYYYHITPDDMCSIEPMGTGTARLDMTDSGLVVTFHPKEVRLIKDSFWLEKDDKEVTIKTDQEIFREFPKLDSGYA